jgi:hypothetical protein
MYKKIITIFIFGWVTTIQSISLDQNLLNNSPVDYLVDLARFINDTNVTKQVGQELFIRNYFSLVTTYAPQSGRFDAKPTNPPEGHPQGQWVWVASSALSETGTWAWILRTLSYYVLFFTHGRPG